MKCKKCKQEYLTHGYKKDLEICYDCYCKEEESCSCMMAISDGNNTCAFCNKKISIDVGGDN